MLGVKSRSYTRHLETTTTWPVIIINVRAGDQYDRSKQVCGGTASAACKRGPRLLELPGTGDAAVLVHRIHQTTSRSLMASQPGGGSTVEIEHSSRSAGPVAG